MNIREDQTKCFMSIENAKAIFKNLQTEVLPYVAWKTVCDVAWDTRTEERERLKKVLVLGSSKRLQLRNDWTKSSIRVIKPATKRQKALALVYSNAKYMFKQEFGLRKDNTAVPNPELYTSTGHIPKRFWAHTLYEKTKNKQHVARYNKLFKDGKGIAGARPKRTTYFLLKENNGEANIMQREPDKEDPKIMFTFKQNVDVSPSWKFRQSGAKYAQGIIVKYFTRAYRKELIRNAKKRKF